MASVLSSIAPAGMFYNSRPAAVFSGLDHRVQDALRGLTSRFEVMDKLVLEEFQDPHRVTDSNNRDIGPVTYDPQSVAQYIELGVREHGDNEVVAYLSQSGYRRYWQIALNRIVESWEFGSLYKSDGKLMSRIKRIEGLTEGLSRMLRLGKHRRQLPHHVYFNIEARIITLETFLDCCEMVMARKDAGSRTSDSAGRPSVDSFIFNRPFVHAPWFC
jgi:hypothetical protein